MTTTESTPPPPREVIRGAVVRFSGDSGDGMQVTGDQFTAAAALARNDLATFPDFPAEIRAPAGTTYGVSGFQIHFSSEDVFTPGDAPDVLVAMNPAALKTNLRDLKQGGLLIVNASAFNAAEPEEGGLREEPARGRLARGLPRGRDRHRQAHAGFGEGDAASRPRTPTAARTSGRWA